MSFTNTVPEKKGSARIMSGQRHRVKQGKRRGKTSRGDDIFQEVL